MLNRNFKRILLIIASLLILIGIVLMAWAYFIHREKTVIKVDLGLSESIKFEELCLLPGEQCDYDLKFVKNGSENSYELTLKFRELETKEEHRLQEFAYARIEAGGEILYDELLIDAFEDEGLTLTVNFKEDINTELKILYYLPIDVGNEAQNAEALFELLITASNE